MPAERGVARISLLVASLLLAGGLPVVSSATERGTDAPDPVRFLVGFHDLSDDLDAGSTYHGAEVLDVNRVLDAARVEVGDQEAFAAAVQEDQRVRYAQEERLMHPAETTPDDPRFDEQYGPQQLKAPAAWDDSTGRTAKNVCVIDTGVRYTHEDLAGARWLGGIDVYNGDDDPWDDWGHGTHVTGIAAAGVDNGVGVAGIANVGFLHAKVFGSSGGTSPLDVATGIQWCADNGADVISMSLGGPVPDPVTLDAVQYAESQGAVQVAAAGNDGCQGCVLYPAAYPQVIAVTCVDRKPSLCSFSSYGPQAEFAAAGSNILSTVNHGDASYGTISGTSMSTPHVSGVAALVWSAFPDLTSDQVRELLRANARDIGPDGRDQRFGYGIPDAGATLGAAFDALGGFPCDVVEPSGTEGVSGTVTVHAESTPDVEAIPMTIDGALVDELDPTAEDPATFTGELEALEYADGPRDVEITCDDGQGNQRRVPLTYVFDNAQAAILEPGDGDTVSGTVEVVVQASSVRGGADEVFAAVDGGPATEITANQVNDTDTYTLAWDTTTHRDDSTPALLEAWFQDHEGFLTEARPVEVAVDNRPDPSVEVVDPEPDQEIVGPYRIWVEATSAVDHEGFRVEVNINGAGWANITENREGEDRYYHDWHGQSVQERTVIRSRVVDHGGQDPDAVQVNATGLGTVLDATGPAYETVVGCVNDLLPLAPAPVINCNVV